MFSTEDPAYGGNGISPADTDENWRIPGHAAIIMIGASGAAVKES
jgi:maltooligosyltrehalose trehalohydrolase